MDNIRSKNVIGLNHCIRNTTAVYNSRQNSRQNSVREKIQFEKKSKKKTFFVRKKILSGKKIVTKKLSWMLSLISSAQSELSRTNRCLSPLSGTYPNEHAE